MDGITQQGYWRQRGIKYARTHGVTEAIRKGYPGTVESLKDRPPTPRHSPRAQSPEERDLVRRYAKKYPYDLPPGYEKPRPYGYAGSYGRFKPRARKLRKTPVKPWWKRKNKPYRPAHYSGQKIQMDVKFPPPYCAAPSAPGTFRKSSLGQRPFPSGSQRPAPAARRSAGTEGTN